MNLLLLLLGHFRDNLSSPALDWCKTPSLLNQSLSRYYQN